MPTIAATKDLTALLEHLIKFPTITGDKATCRAALDWVEQQLEGLPLKVRRPDHGGFSSLIAITPAVKDFKNPRLWLGAHIDVVAASAADFSPEVKNGRIYGRGSHDMKFAIAAYIELLRELGADLAKYDLGLFITSDEESSGAYGAGWLLNDRGYRGGAILMPDSGTPWHFCVGGKGIMRWDLTSTGRAAHGSRPWQGVNAIDQLTRFADHVKRNVPAEPCGIEDHYHDTVVLSTIRGGQAKNQVPDACAATLDIRYMPSTTPARIQTWMQAAEAAVPGVKATSRVSSGPYKLDANHAAVQAYKASLRAVLGRDIPDHFAHGTSDGRWFVWQGIPDLNVGVKGSGYHTSPEWVDIADVTRFQAVTRHFLDSWAKVHK
jgi:acetylornithine deacetylase/succinyl-diaminopimelate desuccinylase-like protein